MKKTILCTVLLAAALTFTSGCSSSDDAPKKPAEAPSPSIEAPATYNGGFTKEQRVSDANMLVGTFERYYGPRDWKKESMEISFEQLSKELLDKAEKDITDVEFYEAIGKYVASFKDIHTSISIPSSAVAYLPMDLDDVDGHVMVTGFSEELAKDLDYGDEVIEMDGRPISDVRDEFAASLGVPNPVAARRFAAESIVYRDQAQGSALPDKSIVQMKIRSKKDGQEKTITMEWKTAGRPLARLNDKGTDLSLGAKAAAAGHAATSPLDQYRNFLYRNYKGHRMLSIGDSRSFFPLGANFIERKAGPLRTGVINADGKRIAYLRIPQFELNIDEVIAQLVDDIPYLESTTDAMILDVTDNPGGNWCLGVAVASFLTDKGMKDLNVAFRANRFSLMDFERALEHDGSLPEKEKELYTAIVDDMRATMASGGLLTKPYPICTAEGEIKPAIDGDGKIYAYTKPILLLQNEHSISCGDLFPALLKDNGRATLFGETTMGGGGSRFDVPVQGYSEISLSYANSLVVRNTEVDAGGKKTSYIENVGVAPDIPYHITLDDFYSGYETYANAAMQAVLSLVDNAAAENAEGGAK
jgi:C-terminal processing protease CtpA/Prc